MKSREKLLYLGCAISGVLLFFGAVTYLNRSALFLIVYLLMLSSLTLIIMPKLFR